MKKLVVVTGGSRGIGRATALLAAKEGWNVVLTFREKKSSADSLVNEIRHLGQEAWALQMDVGSEQSIVECFKTIDEHCGAVDALVNNAGMITPIAKFTELTAERINEVMAVNVTGSLICAREAIKRMALSHGGKGGAIVNLSSVASRIGSPNEFIDYAASKGAIDSFTLGLSKEYAVDGVRVNAIRPGLIETEMHADAGDKDRPEKLKSFIPQRRSGDPEEVAQGIVWLMSDKASYVNGALLDISGGR